MTIQDLLNLEAGDVAKLNTKQMRTAVNKLKAAAKARVKRLQKYEKREGYTSPALKKWREMKHREKYTKLNLNQLRNEFVKYSNFLKTKTSTITGLEEYREHNKKVFGENAEDELYMDLYDEFRTRYKAELEGVPSEVVLEAFDMAYGDRLYQWMQGHWVSKEELFENAMNIIRKAYSNYTKDLNEDFWEYTNPTDTTEDIIAEDILNDGKF